MNFMCSHGGIIVSTYSVRNRLEELEKKISE